MASRGKAWRDMIESALTREGVKLDNVEHTAGSHLRFRGHVTVSGGRKVPVSLTCSLTPSDHRAIHRVRGDIRRMVNAARSIKA